MGGDGDDIYTVQNSGDQIVEQDHLPSHSEGDKVQSSVTFTLPDNVEALWLIGNDDIDGTGNSGRNSIGGNSGDNVLTGGGNKDQFSLDIVSGGVDTITDFSVTDDHIWVDRGGGYIGQLLAGELVIGTAPTTIFTRLIYDDVTGALSYDFNGTEAGGGVQFATLSPGLALRQGNFTWFPFDPFFLIRRTLTKAQAGTSVGHRIDADQFRRARTTLTR